MRCLWVLLLLLAACGDDDGLPYDASVCMGVDASRICAEESFQCRGDVLERCERNINNCIVRTTNDCASIAGGYCDDSVDPPACVVD